MFGNLLRGQVDRVVLPLGRTLAKTGITANALTLAGVPIVAAGAALVAAGKLRAGGLVLVAGSVTDLLDGSIAKTTSGPTRFGGFLDSTTDRVTDGLVFSAVAWHLASDDGAGIGLALALSCLVLSFLTPYIRARAEASGYDCKVGIAERAERVVIVAVGLVFGLLVPALGLLVVLSAITVVQRFVHVWRQGRSAG
ncbi:MAG: CDP-alcohol phosphatidyltransferase family protein [Actinomycetota bacterium]